MDKKDLDTDKDNHPEDALEMPILEASDSVDDKVSHHVLKEKNILGYYIPHRLWIVMIFFFGLVAAMWDQLYIRFLATPELNTVIISTIMIVITLSLMNIIKFQRSAKYINKLSEVEVSGKTEEYRDILEELKKSSYVFDCFTLRKVLENSAEKSIFTPFIVTDKDSMLIKSKVGKRANVMRSNVAYLSGVLVMLGLIGTFWGMLDTLNSVGEAMAGLSGSISGESGLGNFIQSIAKPLEGMGVAFSSSLFGLVGSLVGGLMNNFSSKGMDAFIEDFGFWLDSHIDKPSAFLPIQKAGASGGAKDEKGEKEQASTELSTMKQMSDQFGVLIEVLKGQKASGGGNMQNIGQFASEQTKMVQTMEEYSSTQEQLLDKFIEHTSTQFYTSNAFKQSLDALNATQSKSLQVMFSQSTSSDRLYKEVKNLRTMIYAMSKGEEVKMASPDDGNLGDRLSQSLDEKLSWMQAERLESKQDDQNKASGT